MKTAPVQASFFYKSVFGTASPAAYETSLLDAMQGETMLFTRRDEVEAEWRIITSIEETWTQLSPPNFPNYAAGSDGPVAGDALIAGDHKGWRKLAEDPKNGK